MRTAPLLRDLAGITATSLLVAGLIAARTLYFVHHESDLHVLRTASATQVQSTRVIAHATLR